MKKLKITLGILLGMVLLQLGLAYSYTSPPQIYLDVIKGEPIGVSSANMFKSLINEQLNRSGGWQDNAILPPVSFFNPDWKLIESTSAFQVGTMLAARDYSLIYRLEATKKGSSSIPDKNWEMASLFYMQDTSRVLMPRAQWQYTEGNKYVESYIARLIDNNDADGVFSARVDVLHSFITKAKIQLATYEAQLSKDNLVAESGKAGDPSAEITSKEYQTTNELLLGYNEITPEDTSTKFLYHEARGYAWFIGNMLRSLEIDMEGPIESKQTMEYIQRAYVELLKANEKHVVFVQSGNSVCVNSMLMGCNVTLKNHITKAVFNLGEMINRLEKN